MLLHFQLDAATGWESPQAPSVNISHVLQNPPIQTTLANATPERTALLDELKRCLRPAELIAAVRERVSRRHAQRHDRPAAPGRTSPTTATSNPTNTRRTPPTTTTCASRPRSPTRTRPPQRFDRSVAINSRRNNGENWLRFRNARAPGAEVLVHLTPMTALWMPTEDGRERLLLVRLVRIEEKEVCQGIVLDDDALRRLLADKVADLFPQARLAAGA